LSNIVISQPKIQLVFELARREFPGIDRLKHNRPGLVSVDSSGDQVANSPC
jgi:hypothetical protein